MDIHGLHAEEAQYFVLKRLEFLKVFDADELVVITGVGNHSLDRQMVRPALLAALEKGKFAVDQSYKGKLIIRIRH